LAVEEVLDTEELVIKPATPAIMATGLYAGQTLPDSGRPMLLLDCGGIASAAGLHFTRAAVAVDEADAAVSATLADSALLFIDLDGVRRIALLAAIDRVESVRADAVRFSAGQLRLSVGDSIIPLATVLPPEAAQSIIGRGELNILRMADGRTEIGYAIAEAVDIVSIDHDILSARGSGLIAGVTSIDGEQVEVLDIHALFALSVDPKPMAIEPPICLIAGAERGWMDIFLRPVLEASGYRVATSLASGERAAVILAMTDDVPSLPNDAPILKLRSDVAGGTDSIYRYDRQALLAALDARCATGGR
ncbi:MAG: chemotaxis protein CheA, partial [Sphingopyxis sp.]|nr:chemotaxis protein CheA [Sphingopyxis sp.]